MPVAIETRHIEAILALAEALNFTRAAIQLNLVQSTLSRQIEQVEGIVGFPICVKGGVKGDHCGGVKGSQ